MMADQVKIGRLVLDVPGLEPGQAGLVAEQIAEGLIGLSGDFDRLAVTIDECDIEQLAVRVLAALRQQIG
jgi:hypothetical protein